MTKARGFKENPGGLLP